MTRHQVHPIHFPTTTMFVDDSEPFLLNLSLQLDPDIGYSLFQSPRRALEVLNGQRGREWTMQKYYCKHSYGEEFSSDRHVIDVDVGQIHYEMYNEARFEEISVVVVDYVMPEMSGLEFCRNVSRPGIKKVLLTGKADEKLAIRAFNEGLIERFITKNDDVALATLNRVISELKYEYFAELNTPLLDMLSVGVYGFLRDPVFADAFEQLRLRHGVVEYYLCGNPEGILMVNGAGIPSLLLVCSEDDMRGHYEISLDQGAPQELLDALGDYESIPYFWETKGHYASSIADWRSLLYPAHELRGQRRYFWTIVDNPKHLVTPPTLSYQDYLVKSDQLHGAYGHSG